MLEEARKRDGVNVVRKTSERGVSTTLDAALDPELALQEAVVGYISDCGFIEPAEWFMEMKGQ